MAAGCHEYEEIRWQIPIVHKRPPSELSRSKGNRYIDFTYFHTREGAELLLSASSVRHLRCDFVSVSCLQYSTLIILFNLRHSSLDGFYTMQNPIERINFQISNMRIHTQLRIDNACPDVLGRASSFLGSSIFPCLV